MATERFSMAFADKFYLGRSRTMVQPDDDTYYLIALPKGAFVRRVWLAITTAYVGGVAIITVGWAGNGETAQAAGFISADIADPYTVGLKGSLHDNLLSAEAKWFDSGTGAITCTVSAGGATTEGTFVVFCDYTMIF
jgi:hypothetical protein